MPYEVSWTQDKRIIHCRLFGAFDLEMVNEASNKVEVFINEGQPLVHLIVDMEGLQSFPTNVTKLNAMNQYLKHPNMGWVIVVGGSSLTKFLVNVLSQIIKFRVAQRATMSEALDFLRKQDSTLSAAPASGA